MQQISRFLADGEDAVVDGREVQLLHDGRHFLLFFLGFWVGDDVVFVGLGVWRLQTLRDAHQICGRRRLSFALAVTAVSAQEAPSERFFPLLVLAFGSFLFTFRLLLAFYNFCRFRYWRFGRTRQRYVLRAIHEGDLRIVPLRFACDGQVLKPWRKRRGTVRKWRRGAFGGYSVEKGLVFVVEDRLFDFGLLWSKHQFWPLVTFLAFQRGQIVQHRESSSNFSESTGGGGRQLKTPPQRVTSFQLLEDENGRGFYVDTTTILYDRPFYLYTM